MSGRRFADAPPLADRKPANGRPDYVDLVERVAERSFAVENGRLGWRRPTSDGRRGGSRGKVDIYLVQLGIKGGASQLFGYAPPDLGPTRRSRSGYLVLDDDFARSEYPGSRPLQALKVTTAHEYNHIVQYGYDLFQEDWHAEASSVWMEEEVFDGGNDYLTFLPEWTRRSGSSLTSIAGNKEYGAGVWYLWLARRYGDGIVRSTWRRARRNLGFYSAGNVDRALRAAGPSDLGRDFARFSRDLAEWRTGGFFEEGNTFPDVHRRGRLRPGARSLGWPLDHLSFKLLRVPTWRGRAVEVTARVPAGVRSAVGLVGRIGTERGGRVISRLRFARTGGRITVGLPRPGRFDRLTAVLVNADARLRRPLRFLSLPLSWAYDHERVRFAVSARLRPEQVG